MKFQKEGIETEASKLVDLFLGQKNRNINNTEQVLPPVGGLSTISGSVITYVAVPTRMTLIIMSSGGAPTMVTPMGTTKAPTP
jgi:hypothetical protein